MLTLKDFYAKAQAFGDDEFKATAKHYYDKTVTDNEKKNATAAKKRVTETMPKIKAIEDFFVGNGNEPALLSVISTATGLSVPTVGSIATTMEKEGRLVKYDVKVKGKGTMRALGLVESHYNSLIPHLVKAIDNAEPTDTADTSADAE